MIYTLLKAICGTSCLPPCTSYIKSTPLPSPDEAISSRDVSRTSPSQFTSDITTTSKARTPLAWLTRGPFDCALHLFDIALFNLITTKSNNASHTYKWDSGQRWQPWGPRYKGSK